MVGKHFSLILNASSTLSGFFPVIQRDTVSGVRPMLSASSPWLMPYRFISALRFGYAKKTTVSLALLYARLTPEHYITHLSNGVNNYFEKIGHMANCFNWIDSPWV